MVQDWRPPHPLVANTLFTAAYNTAFNTLGRPSRRPMNQSLPASPTAAPSLGPSTQPFITKQHCMFRHAQTGIKRKLHIHIALELSTACTCRSKIAPLGRMMKRFPSLPCLPPPLRTTFALTGPTWSSRSSHQCEVRRPALCQHRLY